MYTMLKEKVKEKNWKEASFMARGILEKQGLVKLPLGSYWMWIHKEWLERALKEDILRKNSYGQCVPVADAITLKEIVGKKGKEDIVTEKEHISIARFLAFANKYEAFCYAKEKEAEQLKLSGKTD